mmetsp:Transcript_55175/g.99110  ORF Transcript_55175/g.99110 Transcript_55175/m.99110 type:complete len:573 (+) Transcript_55175:2-1720(+)
MNADHRVVLQPMEPEFGPLDRSRLQYPSNTSNHPDMRAAGNPNIVHVRRLNASRRGDGWLCRPSWDNSATRSPGVENIRDGNVSAEVLLSSKGNADIIKPTAAFKYGSRFSRVDSHGACLSAVDGTSNLPKTFDSGYRALTPSPPNHWAEGLRNGSARCVVPDDEALQVVLAAPDDGAIPREFRILSTNLQWNDPRSELESPRKFGGVKKLDLDFLNHTQDGTSSAWVFGGGEENHKEPRQSKRRSQSLTERGSTRRSASLDRGLLLAGPDTARASQAPPTPCERKCKNLEASSRNPLQPCSAQRDIDAVASEQPSTPRRNRTPRYKPGVMPESPRRRVERNYSDLFGRETPREMSNQPSPRSPRCKFGDLAVCTSLDSRAELDRSARTPLSPRDQGHGRARSSPRWDRKRNSSEVFDCPTPDRPKENFSLEEERIWENSRACWDTQTAWDMNAEISRRLRERMMEKGNSSPQTPREASKEPPLTSRSLASDGGASARRLKRLDMASGNVRHGIGATPALWDDGRCGPGPAMERPPTMRMRSYPDSPAFKRSASWNSARSRYFDSVLTSSIL